MVARSRRRGGLEDATRGGLEETAGELIGEQEVTVQVVVGGVMGWRQLGSRDRVRRGW